MKLIFMVDFKNKKLITRLVGMFSVILILAGVAFFQAVEDSGKLVVNFFDVGQGDAILIKTPEHQKILIDGGPNNSVIEKLGENMPFYDRKIDLMILTHPHADHLVGLIEVLKRYEVKKILATGAINSTPDYLAWLEEIRNQDVPMEIARSGQTLDFGENLKMEIFSPIGDFVGKQPDDLNSTSIVAKLIFSETSFLFTGDAEEDTEEEMIAAGVDLKSDVLKIGHHGSRNATSQNFLGVVQPKFAVISVGAKNTFGHPNKTVLNRLEKMGTEIFRTDEEGDVKMTSDGVEIKLKE